MSPSSDWPELSHGGTRRRIQFLLDHVDLHETYTLRELAILCGQPNKPLGMVLRRRCFYQLATIADRKRCGTNSYRPHPPSLQELRLRMETHMSKKEIQLLNGLTTALADGARFHADPSMHRHFSRCVPDAGAVGGNHRADQPDRVPTEGAEQGVELADARAGRPKPTPAELFRDLDDQLVRVGDAAKSMNRRSV